MLAFFVKGWVNDDCDDGRSGISRGFRLWGIKAYVPFRIKTGYRGGGLKRLVQWMARDHKVLASIHHAIHCGSSRPCDFIRHLSGRWSISGGGSVAVMG